MFAKKERKKWEGMRGVSAPRPNEERKTNKMQTGMEYHPLAISSQSFSLWFHVVVVAVGAFVVGENVFC